MAGKTPRDYGPVQLSNYIRAAWPDLIADVPRARHFGLIPGPDRARGRWSAELAEQIRAGWPATAAASKCIGAAGLKRRGWTASLIRDFLGDPDLLVDNPHYKTAAPMRLWRLQRVEAVEATPEFAERKARMDSAMENRRLWRALGGR